MMNPMAMTVRTNTTTISELIRLPWRAGGFLPPRIHCDRFEICRTPNDFGPDSKCDLLDRQEWRSPVTGLCKEKRGAKWRRVDRTDLSASVGEHFLPRAGTCGCRR